MTETFAAHTDWDRAKIREISLEVLEKMRIHNPEEVLAVSTPAFRRNASENHDWAGTGDEAGTSGGR